MKFDCLPGMSVVVYFPPNLVGLKMSDCTVAIAGGEVSQGGRFGFSRPVLLAIGGAARHIDEALRP